MSLGLVVAGLFEWGEIWTQMGSLGQGERPPALQKACPALPESPWAAGPWGQGRDRIALCLQVHEDRL